MKSGSVGLMSQAQVPHGTEGASTFWPLAYRDANPRGSIRQRRLAAAVGFRFEQPFDARVRVNRRCMILHQSASVGGRSVVAVQAAPEHTQHRHLLSTVVRGM